MAESHVEVLLREVLAKTLAGSVPWTRSTEDQIFANIPDPTGPAIRLVVTRRDDRSGLVALAVMAAGHDVPRDIGHIRLTVHRTHAGTASEPHIDIDSRRLPAHKADLQALWRFGQEAADAPVVPVADLLHLLGARAAAEAILKRRAPHLLTAGSPQGEGTTQGDG